MDHPIIVIASCSNIKPKSLVKLISGQTTNALNLENETSVIQAWIIETKYYTAIVDMYGITENFVRKDAFNKQVEAVVIHMDTNKETGLTDLEKWSGLTEDCSPEVKLLICNYCNESTKITKEQATEWCLKRGFEFIELYPKKEVEDNDEHKIIEEKFGVERIVEALQTNFWSNMVTKDPNAKEEKAEVSKDDVFVDTETFSELFSELSTIRECLQSVPSTERKQYAEQMMTKLWKALGGEEEEIIDM